MRKPLSIILTLAMIVTMVIGSAGAAFAADTTEATTMKIAGTDGTVTVTNEKGKEIAAKVDTKLLNGYTIKTAAASYCFISLDDSKAIKLGQNTKVKVEKSGKKIELNVKSGEIYFDVDKKLSGNESMNIKTGNMTTGIRGTSGSVKVVQRKPASAKNLNAAQAVEAIINLFSGTTQTKMGANGGAAMLETVTAGTSLSVSTSLSNEIGNAGNTSATLAGNDGRYSMPQVVVKGAAALDSFAARAILENAAIKSGVTVGEALSAPTAQIVEKAADALEGLSLAGSVKEQLTVQTSDPQTLDAQIAGEEQQAVQQTEEVVQNIEGAKEEAAQVEGTSSDTAESKVIEKVEVKTGSGADAGKVTFEGGGVTVSDTPSGRSGSGGSSGGGNSGGTVELPGITGYAGTYDGQEHPIGTVDADLASNYHVVLFDNEAGYSTCKEAMRSIDSTGGFNTADERYAMLISALDANEVSYEPYTSDGMPQACYVADSHTWSWYALPKVATDSSIFGSFNVSVSRAEISVKWVNSQTNEEVAQNAVFPANTMEIPVEPVLGVYRIVETETHSTQEAFSVFGSDDFFRGWDTITTGSGEARAYFGATVSGNAPQGQAGNYTVEVTSIMHDEDGNDFTGTFQTDNFCFSGQGKYYSYSVAEASQSDPGPAGFVIGEHFFDADNIEAWSDWEQYDVAFVAGSTGQVVSDTPLFTMYEKGEQVAQNVALSDVLKILDDNVDEPGGAGVATTYASIYLDTGSEELSFGRSINIRATGSTSRAVFVTGAGFSTEDDNGTGQLWMLNATDVAGVELFVKFGADGTETNIVADEINVGPETTLINSAEIVIGSNELQARDGGKIINEGKITMGEGATGSIWLNDNGMFYQNAGATIIDERYSEINSDHIFVGDPERLFKLSGESKAYLYDGRIIRRANIPSSDNEADKIKYAVMAIFGNEVFYEPDRYEYTYTEGLESFIAPVWKFRYNENLVYGGGGEICGGERTSSGVSLSDGYFWATPSNVVIDPEIDDENIEGYIMITFPVSDTDRFTPYTQP